MKELQSNCCGAEPQGELSNNFNGVLEGRCSDCKEMTGFTGIIEVNFVSSIKPLGTEDGINYNIYPQGHYA